MNFLNKEEQKKTSAFLKTGYLICKVENMSSLKYISSLISKSINLQLKKNKSLNLNKIHETLQIKELNNFRLNIISKINKDKLFRYHYFNLAKETLYLLAGNELMMQKNINLSIQFPNDNSSLLPIHSDVWSGDSAYELNLWIPLVDCYKTKSMLILKKKYLPYFYNKMKNKKIKNSKDIFNIIKNKIEWIDIKYGEFLIFDQTVPHGNVINKEITTRFSLNCRFKSLFSPYADKRIGEFFEPITIRASTRIGKNFSFPFTE